MLDEVLSKEQVAELLACDTTTIEEKARNGELPGVKVGRSWIFPREALLQRLNEMALSRDKRKRAGNALKERIEEDTQRRQTVMPLNSIFSRAQPSAKQGHRPDIP